MPQITLQNDLQKRTHHFGSVSEWLTIYLEKEVTTLESSRKVQKRDIEIFIAFMQNSVGSDNCSEWTPRLSRHFISTLQRTRIESGKRHWQDNTINRMLAHLKTFANWISTLINFPLGNPMRKIKSISTGTILNIERAVTPSERRKILDAADLLLEIGGLSKDRNRIKEVKKRKKRKTYRPYRNRAIIYTLMETGMRRAATTSLRIWDIDFDKRILKAITKGGAIHPYPISREGINAIKDYIEKERENDNERYQTSILFLPSKTSRNSSGKLHPNAINYIWNEVSLTAGVSGKTPHSARHAIGVHIIEKTGNPEAVQRQLGHKNATYSLQYSRITEEKLKNVLDDRE